MKKCKYCQTEIDSNAKICPNCKKKQKGFPTWAIVLIVIVVIIIIGGVASEGSSGNSNSKDSKTGTTTQKTENLSLEEGHTGALDQSGIGYYIEGYIKNNSDKDYSYVQVTFTTYDSEGNTLGTCLDNNSGLEANGRWKFKALCTSEVDKIASYKLKEINKW